MKPESPQDMKRPLVEASDQENINGVVKLAK